MIGCYIWDFRVTLSKKYDRVVKAASYLNDFQVHLLWLLTFVSAFTYFQWCVGQIWHLSWHCLVVDVSVSKLAVVTSPEGVEMSIFADQQCVVAPASHLDRLYVFLENIFLVVVNVTCLGPGRRICAH